MVAHLAFGVFGSKYDQNGTQSIQVESYMRPGCIWSRFAKIDFWSILVPKVPSLEFSNVRNLEFWIRVCGSPFRVFGAKCDQNGTQSIQIESHMRPGCICSRFGKFYFCQIFGPKVPPLQNNKCSGFGILVFGMRYPI